MSQAFFNSPELPADKYLLSFSSDDVAEQFGRITRFDLDEIEKCSKYLVTLRISEAPTASLERE
jgi:hypothetical protein